MKTAAIIVVAFVLLPAAARADNFALADEHARLAKAHILTGHLGDAIKDYEHAFQASPQPKYIYNIGELHRRLAEAGAIDEMRASREFFTRYLELQPNAPDRRQVEARIIALRARIESAEAAARETSVRTTEPPSKAPVEDSPHGELPQEAVTPPPVTPAPRVERRRAIPTWGWVVIGVGAAAVAATSIGLGIGLSHDQPPGSTLGDQGVHF